MSGLEITGVITALSAFFGGLYATYRASKADRLKSNSDSASLVLAGWEKLNKSITEEVERVKKSCSEQIETLKKEHAEDREEWAAEKNTLLDRLRAQDHKIEQQDSTIAGLKIQMYEFLNRPMDARERKDDK